MAVEPIREDLGRKVLWWDDVDFAQEGVLVGHTDVHAYVKFGHHPFTTTVVSLEDLEWAYPRVIEKDRNMDQVPKYPHVHVNLTEEDGNAFAILSRTQKLLKSVGCEAEELNKFFTEATAEDYDHLLVTVARWVNIS